MTVSDVILNRRPLQHAVTEYVDHQPGSPSALLRRGTFRAVCCANTVAQGVSWPFMASRRIGRMLVRLLCLGAVRRPARVERPLP
jgi:hypothetical protein